MTKISSSPGRHTFQAENYVKRCIEEGKEPNKEYLNMYESFRQQDEKNIVDPAWQKNNMEYDLRSTDWILEKVRTSDVYAQNLYAAMCNMQWCRREMWPILKEDYWSCSWRHSGGIIADMKEEGDYIDWYCSGIRNDTDPEAPVGPYVPEGIVTDEIRDDLYKLGWIPVPWNNEE